MFLIKIFHFLKGYVILSLWGQNKEKFLDSAIKNGIKIIFIKNVGERLIIKVPVKDFFELKNIKPRCKLHIEKRAGTRFLLKKLKKRKAFMLGGCVFLLIFVVGSQFVWDIDYDGADGCDMERLSEAVRQAGLYEGMPKFRIKGGHEMKNIILNNTDDICWAWVYVKGTRVTVSVRKSIIPPQIFDKNVPCDIIAARSGIIKRVIGYNGRIVVAENQAVAPGDTIISGRYEFENQLGYQTHAAGVAEAYTHHEKSGEYKLNYCYKKYTGRVQRLVNVRLFKWEIPLYFKEKTVFDEYELSEKDYEIVALGVGISTKTMAEYFVEKEPISYDLAVELAKRELSEEISKELLPGAEKLSEECVSEKIDEETVRVTVLMDFIEKIGTEKRTEEVDFVEPKTDRNAAGD